MCFHHTSKRSKNHTKKSLKKNWITKTTTSTPQLLFYNMKSICILLCLLFHNNNVQSSSSSIPSDEYVQSTPNTGTTNTNNNNDIITQNNNNNNNEEKDSDVVKHILQNLSNVPTSTTWINDEEATILDVFGQVAKDVLTNRLIPETDSICDWKWKHFRCEPHCLCSLQFQWGDYHLGRSCRQRDEYSHDNNIESDHTFTTTYNNDHNNDHNNFMIDESCNIPPDTTFVKTIDTSGRIIKMIGFETRAKLAGFKFIMKNRVDHMREDICTSLLSRSDDDDDEEEMVIDIDGNYVDQIINNNHHDDSDISGSELLEKPVRALRKVLNCNSISNGHISNQDPLLFSKTKQKVNNNNNNNESNNRNRKLKRKHKEKRNPFIDDDNSNSLLFHNDDELHDIPVLTNNPMFVKGNNNNNNHSRKNNVGGRKSISNDDEDDDILDHRKIIHGM